MARSLNSDAYGTIFQTNGMTTPGIFSFYILQISIDSISVHTLFHISNFFPLFQMFHVYFVCSPSTSIVSYSAIYTLHSFSCFAIPYLIWRNELVFFFQQIFTLRTNIQSRTNKHFSGYQCWWLKQLQDNGTICGIVKNTVMI